MKELGTVMSLVHCVLMYCCIYLYVCPSTLHCDQYSVTMQLLQTRLQIWQEGSH